MNKIKNLKLSLARMMTVLMVVLATFTMAAPQLASAADVCGGSVSGKQYASVKTDFNFGCTGKGNAIVDFVFAIVRFLSTGVGFVLVASMVWAGIQYTGSRGDPQATAKAVTRIRANVVALLLFIFAYAIINFVVPGVVLG